MLRFVGFLVLEMCESLGDVIEHQDVDSAAIVVPVYVHAKVALYIPVNGAFLVIIENFCEMVGCSRPTYLIRKSLTQRVNEKGHQSCL
jgi:hypothetical protein